MMESNTRYMLRCLELAEKGLGSVAPNPMVGSVVVHEGNIIGEGYHQQYGEAHAEVNALASVQNKDLLTESTLFVNLEPCSHYGKTPPCCDLLIEKKIKKVVIACQDSNPQVAGKGIERLKQAGIEVICGILEKEARALNKRFFTFHERKRPYIILKWAQSKDGFLSKKPPFTRAENWITGPESQQLVHAWRAQEQAILVGTQTAILDNPALTVRLCKGKNPIRILIDQDLQVPITQAIFSEEAETIVFTQKQIVYPNRISLVKLDFSQPVIEQILGYLYHAKISSLIVEGGAYTLQQFIASGLWDEARVFTGNSVFNEGIAAPKLQEKGCGAKQIGEDQLIFFTRSISG